MAAQTEWTKMLTDNGAPPNVGSSTAVRLKNRETVGERPAAHALRSWFGSFAAAYFLFAKRLQQERWRGSVLLESEPFDRSGKTS